MSNKTRFSDPGLTQIDLARLGESPGVFEFEKMSLRRKSATLTSGFYRFNRGSYYGWVEETAADAPAIFTTLTQDEFVSKLELIRVFSQMIEIRPDQCLSNWRSDLAKLAQELSRGRVILGTELSDHLYKENIDPSLQLAISKGYNDESLAILIRLAQVFQQQQSTDDTPKNNTHKHGSIDKRQGFPALEVRLYQPSRNPYLDQVKLICREHSYESGMAWDGNARAWVVDISAYEPLSVICDWDISQIADLEIKRQRNEQIIEETKIESPAPHYRGMHPILIDAMNIMLPQCDGASTRDNKGFNGHDSSFARQAMAQFKAHGSIPFKLQVKLAARLKKYHAQLSGIQIPSESEIRDYLEKCGEEVFDGLLKLGDEGQGTFLQVFFEYDEATKEAVKEVCSAYTHRSFKKFDMRSSAWQLRLHGLKEIMDLPYKWKLSEEIQSIFHGDMTYSDYRAIEPESDELRLVPEAKEKVIITDDYKGKLMVFFRPLPPILFLVKIKFRGSFRKTQKFGAFWLIPQNDACRLHHFLSQSESKFTFDDETMRLVIQQKPEFDRQMAVTDLERKESASNLIAAAELDKPLPNGWTFFPHQIKAIEWTAHRLVERGFFDETTDFSFLAAILALDMGLGKTMISLVIAKAYMKLFPETTKVIVVCPAFLIPNWKEEAKDLSLGFMPEIYSYTTPPQPHDLEHPFFLICDEAHYLGNLDSIRTQKLLDIASHSNIKAAIPMTGTPMKNGLPRELFPLLMMCRHTLSGNQKSYFSYYCNARRKQMGKRTYWDTSGAQNLDDLFKNTRNVMLRLTKDELDLPSKTRIFRPIELSESAKSKYEQRWTELQDEYHGRVKDGTISGEGEAMVVLGHLRQAASIAKIEYAKSLAMEAASQGDPVILFTEYKETAYKLQEELGRGCAIITGDQSKEARQATKNEFQDGKHRFLVCTSRAGGVGLTLTKASNLIMVDRPWTPGDAVQCEDRIFRIGQTKPVFTFWLQYGIDEKVDGILDDKEARIQKVLTGERKTLRGVRSVAQCAQAILQREFNATT